MNDEEAKKTLAMYRPGTADQDDPRFKEALERAKQSSPHGQGDADHELGRWFQEHCSSYLSVRKKFLDIPVPEGLKDKILREVTPPARNIIIFRPIVFLKAAAVLALCLGLVALYRHPQSREDEFSTYQSRMVRTALQLYGMVPGRDLQTINMFLAGHKAPTDYVLPQGVSKAQPVGCAVLEWQGQPVSMLCFRSGQPLPPGRQSDLWLFVVDGSTVRNGPASPSPAIAKVSKLMTASWTQYGKTYILAAAGDEQFLRIFL
jgi:hypothetical protein